MAKVVQENKDITDAEQVEARFSDVIYPVDLAEHEAEGVVLVDATIGDLWKTKTYLRPYGVCRAIRFEPDGIPQEDLRFILGLVYDAIVPGGAIYTPGNTTKALFESIPVSFVSKTDGFSKFTK